MEPNVHDKMERGPVLAFLRALGERIAGRPATLNVSVDRWLKARVAHTTSALIVAPNLNSELVNRISMLSQHAEVRVFLSATLSPSDKIRLESFADIWGKSVSLRGTSSGRSVVGVYRLDGWELIVFPSGSPIDGDTILDGAECFDGQGARDFVERVQTQSQDLELGSTRPAEMINLRAGQPATESELFGTLFERVIDSVKIEDRYLYDQLHFKRLKAWLSLVKTCAKVNVCMLKASPGQLDGQQRLMSQLKADFRGRLEIEFRRAERTSQLRHDRRIQLDGPARWS